MKWPTLALLSLSLWFPSAQAQVESVKSYLIERVTQQKAATAQLAEAAGRYEAIVRNAGFQYASLAQQHGPAIRNALRDARMAWIKASPIYESVEGIVAGVELLSDFDLNLDAGASGAEGVMPWSPSTLNLPMARFSPPRQPFWCFRRQSVGQRTRFLLRGGF